MIDINLLRETLDEVVKKLKSRGYEFDTKFFINLEKDRKSFQIKTQELQEMRNQLSKNIGVEKSQGKNIDELMAKVSDISANLKKFEISLNETQLKLNNYLLEIPNIPHDSVPLGRNVKDNVDVASEYGLDFDLGTKLSGSRFTLMRSQIARLHRAIGQFMLDVQVNEHGYEECYTPFLVNPESLIGTGQLPKFEDDLFVTKRGENDLLYLIPTGEVPLTNIVRDSIQNIDDLPIKLTALTPCFRSEAGSYGKDTRGMIRQD